MDTTTPNKTDTTTQQIDQVRKAYLTYLYILTIEAFSAPQYQQVDPSFSEFITKCQQEIANLVGDTPK
jgi:hypothetical protein